MVNITVRVVVLQIFRVPFQLMRTQAFYDFWMETANHLTVNHIDVYLILIASYPEQKYLSTKELPEAHGHYQ